MPRSTRARIRSESASLSLSLPTRRTRANTAADRNHPVGKGEERLDEGSQVSFASASTASLPERYIVKASHLPGEVWTAKEQDLLHVKGAEYISDGWRRGEMEGNVAELREIRRRERAGIVVQGASANAQLNDAPTEGSKLDLSVLWYSTPLVFPRLSKCSAFLRRRGFLMSEDLETHQLHWTPRSLPPRAAALNSLEPLDPALVPLVGCHIPLWASNPLQDLDPAQDDLEDFANGWQDANGTGWDDKLLVKSLGKIEDWSLECDDAVEEVNTSGSADLFAPPEKVKTLDFNANRRVAHDKAAGLARPTDSVVLDSSDEAVAGRVPLMDVAPSSETDWIFQSKRRKKWWRDEIASKEGYNRLWDFIPRVSRAAIPPRPPVLPYSIDSSLLRDPSERFGMLITSASCHAATASTATLRDNFHLPSVANPTGLQAVPLLLSAAHHSSPSSSPFFLHCRESTRACLLDDTYRWAGAHTRLE